MAILSLVVFYITSSIHVEKREPAYEMKIQAAQRMARSMQILKDVRMEAAVFIDDVNDPNETALVGSQFTHITTDEGDLDAKISILDPNVAAMVVDYLDRAGLQSGDTVAITVTGSMPGGNLAVYCAVEELGLYPVIVSSVGASQWGANVDDFTWLDMERILVDSGLISFHSQAASLGGGSDIGRRLSPRGRDLIREAIQRNEVPFLSSSDLENAIENRIELFTADMELNRYKAFINVGGGAAVLGDALTARLIQPGLSTRVDLPTLRSDGVLSHFGREGVPVIHILNIREMFDDFEYPYASTPTPELGTGSFYASERYSPAATAIALALLLGMLITVGLNSKRKIRDYLEEHEPESYA